MRWRFHAVLFFFVFLFLFIISRLFYWQIVQAENLSAMAKDQYGQLHTLSPQRGEILSSDGFSLVANQLRYLVFANPKEIKDKEGASKLLGYLTDLDPASVSAQLSLDKFWVPIKPGIDGKTKLAIQKENLPGIGFEPQYRRFYPEASMAAQLLGFVGKNTDGENEGYYGIEGYYDRQLRGKNGTAIEIHDAFGRPILAKQNDQSNAIDGRTLTLHIDRTIQYILEEKLKNGVDKYGASSGTAAVMDPRTGAILAMASFPSFDPLSYFNYPTDTYKNPFISDLYEPGSTFKPLVMAKAIDDGLVTPLTKCTACGGPVSIGGYQIRTWNNKYEAGITMNDVIVHSDNTGMVFVSKLLGADRMLSVFDSFGIGKLTGIDLEGEIASPIKQKKYWYPTDLATASFGQGISVTPIELLDGISAIANGGVRMQPQVVASIQTPEGKTIIIPPKVLDRPISATTAKVITEIMVNAVNKGEAQFARLKGYRIAGKTGTAQIPIDGHYDPTKTIASFVGFAPADNPKFAMLVVFDKPSSSIYGAETAAPVFFDIAKEILLYYGIAPSEN